MKYFLVFALIAAVASAQANLKPKNLSSLSEEQMAEVQEIWDAIHSDSTDPTTAAMLEEMLLDILGMEPIKPIIIPGIIEDHPDPIHIPGIVDEEYHPDPIHIPGIVDEEYHPDPIHIPGIVEESDQPAPIHIPGIIEYPVAPNPAAPSSSPLVQIIVNVNQQSEQTVPGEHDVDRPTPVDVAEEEEIEASPVEVVEEEDQVIVVDELEEIEPVNIAPIIVAPAVVQPETLN